MIVCNDEKLASGGTTEYIRSAKQLLRDEIFKDDGSAWPNVILAPSFMHGGEDEYILPVEVRNLTHDPAAGEVALAAHRSLAGSHFPSLSSTLIVQFAFFMHQASRLVALTCRTVQKKGCFKYVVLMSNLYFYP